jgi:hypothetical protein
MCRLHRTVNCPNNVHVGHTSLVPYMLYKFCTYLALHSLVYCTNSGMFYHLTPFIKRNVLSSNTTIELPVFVSMGTNILINGI